ncbi:MAG TPA: flagellar hook-basal body complex protein FliE [Steroidobacteraceae bacterium]|jgi:flagellar hook-basal body complex protein FliE
MSVPAIASLGGSTDLAQVAAVAAPQPPEGVFESIMGAVSGLNSQLLAGEHAVEQVALGKMDSLHQVAMTTEHVRLEFELMLSVRNKVLDAYQELMRMQV